MVSVCVHCWACCLFLCLLGGSSLHLRTAPGGKELGEQVGSNIRAADEQVSAEASQNSGKSDFQQSYAETLTSKEMVLVNPEVSKVMKQTNALASSLLESSQGLCERNWVAKCPDGWLLVGDDLCLAPTAYGGACKRLLSLSGKGMAERQQIAEDCQSPWPCSDSCIEGREYSNLCPEGWVENSAGGFCDAPLGVETKCATSYNFAKMNIQTKQELAQTCSFNWKCKADCDQDWSQKCPTGWIEVPMNPGLCTAPASYSGICSFRVNTSHMTANQKDIFARKCGVKFPCLAPGSAAAASAASAAEENADLMLDGPVHDGQIVAVMKIRVASAETIAMPATDKLRKMFDIPSGPERMEAFTDKTHMR